MDEYVVVAIVMAVPVLLMVELRKLLTNLFVNRSIRKALDTDPAVAASLVDKLDLPPPSPISPLGLGALLIGASYLISMTFMPETPEPMEIGISAGVTLFGAAMLGARWIERRRKAITAQ